MLSGYCTEALSIQANVTISGFSAKRIKNGTVPLPFPLPALLKQYWYIWRGERVRVRGHAPFYATLGTIQEYSRGKSIMRWPRGFRSPEATETHRLIVPSLGFLKADRCHLSISYCAHTLSLGIRF